VLFNNQPHLSYGIPKGWVREALAHGEAIITNAVLGMRDSKSAAGELSPIEHYIGMSKWWIAFGTEADAGHSFRLRGVGDHVA